MEQIILLSGGMDSLISYRLFYPNAHPVFVQTGSRYQELDYVRARAQAPHLTTLAMPKLRELPDGVVPHRNAAMLAVVANATGAKEIIVSAPRGEMIWDQQPAFHRAISKALGGVRITNALGALTKTQAVQAWRADGMSTLGLLHSRSCYGTGVYHCGNCAACVKRWIALSNNGIHEFYENNPRDYAEYLAEGGTLRDLLRYGVRPAWEAYKAIVR